MEDFILSFPIDFIKKEQRIVSGIATADNIDKSGDLVNFDASIEAFKNWGGNIREMHAPIAVGKAIKYEPIKMQSKLRPTYQKAQKTHGKKFLMGRLLLFQLAERL